MHIYHGIFFSRDESFGYVQGYSIADATDEDIVTVTAGAGTTEFTITVIPDDRVPATGNWSNSQTVRLRPCSGGSIQHTSTNVLTDNNGDGTVNIPAATQISGSKRVEIRGQSHLNKNVGCVDFNKIIVDANFTSPSQYLTPGEVSNTYDNFVNSLDASPMISQFGTNTVKYDLNLDGIVDQDDLTILAGNLYVQGD